MHNVQNHNPVGVHNELFSSRKVGAAHFVATSFRLHGVLSLRPDEHLFVGLAVARTIAAAFSYPDPLVPREYFQMRPETTKAGKVILLSKKPRRSSLGLWNPGQTDLHDGSTSSRERALCVWMSRGWREVRKIFRIPASVQSYLSCGRSNLTDSKISCEALECC